jgi:hypothetical protein
VIIVDTRSSMVAVDFTAAVGCAFDFRADVYMKFLGGSVAGPVNFGA